MNNSNLTNQTLFYLSKKQFNNVMGYNIIIESLQLYLMTPLNLMGFILNPLRFFILKNKRFNTTPLFGYLKVYSVNSTVLNLLLFFNFLFYRFDFSYDYGLQFYYCY